jgi:hypothetical protein
VCPVCKVKTTIDNLGTNRIAEELVQDLEIICSDKNICKWKGKLKTLKKHLTTCPAIEVKCHNKNCRFTGPRINLEQHLNECEFRKFQCEYCGQFEFLKYSEIHKSKCIGLNLLIASLAVAMLILTVKLLEKLTIVFVKQLFH